MSFPTNFSSSTNSHSCQQEVQPMLRRCYSCWKFLIDRTGSFAHPQQQTLGLPESHLPKLYNPAQLHIHWFWKIRWLYGIVPPCLYMGMLPLDSNLKLASNFTLRFDVVEGIVHSAALTARIPEWLTAVNKLLNWKFLLSFVHDGRKAFNCSNSWKCISTRAIAHILYRAYCSIGYPVNIWTIFFWFFFDLKGFLYFCFCFKMIEIYLLELFISKGSKLIHSHRVSFADFGIMLIYFLQVFHEYFIPIHVLLFRKLHLIFGFPVFKCSLRGLRKPYWM